MEKQCFLSSLFKLHVDRACLQLENYDKEHTIEVWGQSSECYACSPWKYVSVKKEEVVSMIVNSTYSTKIYLHLPFEEKDIHRYSYHFSQHGLYGIAFNSTTFSPINVKLPGNDEYMLLLYALLLFILLYGSYFFTKFAFRSFQLLNSEESTETLIEGETTQESSDDIDHNTAEGTDHPLTGDTNSSYCGNTVGVGDRRLHSLDTFRGLSIVLMIFVNYGGGKFYFFQHSPWNGLTIADLVFPWFLWIMGVCITLSVKSQLRKGIGKMAIVWKISQRSLKLFFLGIILNSISDNNLHTLRIMGVLQRFSICYFVNGLLEVAVMTVDDNSDDTNVWQWKVRDIYWNWISWLVIGIITVTHILCTFLLTVPNCPSGYLGPGGLHEQGKYFNCTGGAAKYIDQLILGERHMYDHPVSKVIYDNPGVFDPEGLFSTLMACLTVALGVAAGRIIIYFPNHKQRILRWLIWSLILGFLGAFICGWSKESGAIPVNKNLWSISFVFVTGSFAFILFACIYTLVDVMKLWTGYPFSIAGLNSIFIYCGHEFTKNVLPFSWQPISNNHRSHLIMNVSGASLWIVIAVWMDLRRLYFVI